MSFTKIELPNHIKGDLYLGDNLDIMKSLPNMSIDLIYIDPPFFSSRDYAVIWGDDNEIRSFVDMWDGGMKEYLIWLNARLFEMKRLLKRTGSIYVHLDWHAVHYVKVEMDKIFGYDNFRNEVVWCYAGGGTPKMEFPRKHDNIIWYTKSDNWAFNVEYRPYSDGTQQRGRTQIKGKYFDEGLRKEGTPINDWWTDVKKITSPTDPEKIGYPTQKPEALLERIIKGSSNPGDMVADFFGGSGTTAAVAQRLNRKWITCDKSEKSIEVIKSRLLGNKSIKDKGYQLDIENSW